MPKLLILDGNSIANRAFYGIRLLTNKDGLFTNAIFGFLNILFRYLDTEQPDHVCVTFDTGKPTFRHLQFEAYKAQRKGMPNELAMQMPVLKDALKALGMPMLSLDGYEADDLIGTLSKKCQNAEFECIIATGDRDSLQLVDDQKVKVYLTKTQGGAPIKEVYDQQAVFEKYGITPEQLIDTKGLMGDASDNIPGVAGIGEKTALSLIKQFSSVDGVYENIESLKGSMKEKLINGKDMAYKSQELARIDTAVPLGIELDDLKPQPQNIEELKKIFENLEFRSFLKRLDIEHSDISKTNSINGEIHILSELDEAQSAVKEAENRGESCYSLFEENGELTGFSFTTAEDKVYFVPFSADPFRVAINSYFENFNINKTGHNIKEDILTLWSNEINLNGGDFDTALAAYIIEPSRTNYDIIRLTADVTGLTLQSDEPVQLVCQKVLAIEQLKKFYKSELERLEQHELFYNVELPLTFALAEMQHIGFKVDREKLQEFSALLETKIKTVEQGIFETSGKTFNINSPKQLGEVLFDHLGLPVVRKTKTGYSTDAEVLEKLSDKHPVIEMISEYRTLAKLKSTYSDGLQQTINPITGKIHSKFNQTVTVTGRISSTEPNLQNIPIRMELGREIRKMFIASSDEYCLLDADYSQIELRVLAHISDDPAMIDAFNTNKDIHTITASQVFGVPLDEVTSLMRGRAKAVNFGIVYGIGDFALSQDLKITRKEARAYIDSYLETYSGVKQYMNDIVEKAQEQGYVTTILNRRRYIPELKSQKVSERNFGQRIALNTPIQGSAADIIKLAMVKVDNALRGGNYKSRLILQVHDELIVETHLSEVEAVAEILKREMEGAYPLSIPLVAEVKQGNSWFEAK